MFSYVGVELTPLKQPSIKTAICRDTYALLIELIVQLSNAEKNRITILV
jgi:hypothetical protein